MDLQKQLKKAAEQTMENNQAAKKITELSIKKYDFIKTLKDLESELSIKKNDFDRIKALVISLSCEFPVWQEKARISRKSLECLVRQVVEQEEKTCKIQSELWKKINDWVDRSSQYFQKNNTSEIEIAKGLEFDEKEEKLRQLKLEGQLEALRAYEKYLTRRIKEIEKIRNLVQNVDNLPFHV